MSGYGEGPVTNEDIQRQLNILERIGNFVEGEDDILRAMVQNQTIMLQQMGVMVGAGDTPQLSRNQAGLAIQEIREGDTGQAVFKINGENYVIRVQADREIDPDDVVYVNDTPNTVIPATGVDEGALFGISGSGIPRAPQAFEIDETEEPVTIGAGETKEILSANASGGGFWWETGTTDREYTEYIYTVDGENIFDENPEAPLGLFNDRYRFPQPITFNNNISIKARRQNDPAVSDETFVSKIAYYDV